MGLVEELKAMRAEAAEVAVLVADLDLAAKRAALAGDDGAELAAQHVAGARARLAGLRSLAREHAAALNALARGHAAALNALARGHR